MKKITKIVLLSLGLMHSSSISAYFSEPSNRQCTKQFEGGVWQRIASSNKIKFSYNKHADDYKKWFIQHPNFLVVISEHASSFLYMIVKELEQRHLPIELALLPIIESSYIPSATSRVSAAGIWQLTGPTAKEFGTRVYPWFDGRRNIFESTNAALDLLKHLYEANEHNWLYAMGAYNAGQGTINNAISGNLSKQPSIWSLKLPRETKNYIAKFEALKFVISRAKKYHIVLPEIPYKPVIAVEKIYGKADLTKMISKARVSYKEFLKLNPGLKQWETVKGDYHYILLPINSTIKDAGYSKERVLKWVLYSVRSHDTLYSIAKKFQTTATSLKSINKLSGDKLYLGQELKVLKSVPL
ncbi:LysM peptidoglycan-binding domain-containing protein [Parashewanella spongiae]|uniref:LysM peptidoglycan-binding domain-containing protein n=1 Tax=Parashewanella spongiae TaxID=342950 RepID=A0A3A6UNB0_9GAMM|nr:transglycosylase SLT domain-containing protein [Parashewanella spongiae]MCL1076805.1 transglycosylase SLT domain-containing protein [Parashewanella spongiae]RJY19271.1 LysM peptidoglycan-binding domain-containing protein [Parashewanella spongiae]